jgi:hypothetical protein
MLDGWQNSAHDYPIETEFLSELGFFSKCAYEARNKAVLKAHLPKLDGEITSFFV